MDPAGILEIAEQAGCARQQRAAGAAPAVREGERMIIDKLEPYWTDADRAELDEIAEKERKSLDPEMLACLFARLFSQKEKNEDGERKRVWERVLQRYCESIEDPAGILEDVREICERIEKEDYYIWLETEKQASERAIAIIKSFFSGLDDPGMRDCLKTFEKDQKKRVARGFSSYKDFIEEQARAQIEACEKLNREDVKNQVMDIIEARAAAGYKKPAEKGTRANEKQKKSATTKPKGYKNDPEGILKHDLNRALTDYIDDANRRRQKYNPRTKIAVKEENGNTLVTYDTKPGKAKNSQSYVEILLREIRSSELQGAKLTLAKKILSRSLRRLSESHELDYFEPDEKKNIVIEFPMDDFLDVENGKSTGKFTNRDAAYRALKQAGDLLGSVSMKYDMQTGSKRSAQHSFKNPFAEVTFKYDLTCKVIFYGGVNWKSDWMEYYSIKPNFLEELPEKSFELMDYIFYRARQECIAIAENGYFKISHRSLHDNMGLPPETVQRPDRAIKKVINDAIDEIEERMRLDGYVAENGKPEIYLERYKGPTKNITEYLDKGYLTVHFNGEPLEYFKKIYSKRLIEERKK